MQAPSRDILRKDSPCRRCQAQRHRHRCPHRSTLRRSTGRPIQLHRFRRKESRQMKPRRCSHPTGRSRCSAGRPSQHRRHSTLRRPKRKQRQSPRGLPSTRVQVKSSLLTLLRSTSTGQRSFADSSTALGRMTDTTVRKKSAYRRRSCALTDREKAEKRRPIARLTCSEPGPTSQRRRRVAKVATRSPNGPHLLAAGRAKHEPVPRTVRRSARRVVARCSHSAVTTRESASA